MIPAKTIFGVAALAAVPILLALAFSESGPRTGGEPKASTPQGIISAGRGAGAGGSAWHGLSQPNDGERRHCRRPVEADGARGAGFAVRTAQQRRRDDRTRQAAGDHRGAPRPGSRGQPPLTADSDKRAGRKTEAEETPQTSPPSLGRCTTRRPSPCRRRSSRSARAGEQRYSFRMTRARSRSQASRAHYF